MSASTRHRHRIAVRYIRSVIAIAASACSATGDMNDEDVHAPIVAIGVPHVHCDL
jgi:hypothetical protein